MKQQENEGDEEEGDEDDDSESFDDMDDEDDDYDDDIDNQEREEFKVTYDNVQEYAIIDRLFNAQFMAEQVHILFHRFLISNRTPKRRYPSKRMR